MWWSSGRLYSIVYDDYETARNEAESRNAVMVTINGNDIDVEDWYRKDVNNQPLKTEWTNT